MKCSEEIGDQKRFLCTSLKGLFIHIIGSSYPGITLHGSSACARFYQLACKSACLQEGQPPPQPGDNGRRAGHPGPAAAAGSKNPASPTAIFRHSRVRF